MISKHIGLAIGNVNATFPNGIAPYYSGLNDLIDKTLHHDITTKKQKNRNT